MSVAEKRRKGELSAAKLAKKEGRKPQPVIANGRKLASTFWGIKWCENLERYRVIANRLPRGATYARNGSVVDLVIDPGVIRALVAGSEVYKVRIDIKTLAPKKWQSILDACSREIHSLLDLLAGRLSDGVMRRLTHADDGLLPRSQEISMSCDCPDSAGVCKHLAAVFYCVGARLDEQPELLFKLRKVDHMELITKATESENLDRALSPENDSGLSSDDLASIFGIELEDASEPTKKPRKATKRSPKKSPKKATKKPRGKK